MAPVAARARFSYRASTPTSDAAASSTSWSLPAVLDDLVARRTPTKAVSAASVAITATSSTDAPNLVSMAVRRPVASDPSVTAPASTEPPASRGSSPAASTPSSQPRAPGPAVAPPTTAPKLPATTTPKLPPTTDPPPPATAPKPVAPAPPRHSSEGEASWYPAPTGTCASPDLAFGTVVTVTDLSTGASIVCTVDDREAPNPGRVIDLSQGSFAQLADLAAGLIDVRLTW
jgi:rare lipoprotein A (peptidoglycan hydrolase)